MTIENGIRILAGTMMLLALTLGDDGIMTWTKAGEPKPMRWKRK